MACSLFQLLDRSVVAIVLLLLHGAPQLGILVVVLEKKLQHNPRFCYGTVSDTVAISVSEDDDDNDNIHHFFRKIHQYIILTMGAHADETKNEPLEKGFATLLTLRFVLAITLLSPPV